MKGWCMYLNTIHTVLSVCMIIILSNLIRRDVFVNGFGLSSKFFLYSPFNTYPQTRDARLYSKVKEHDFNYKSLDQQFNRQLQAVLYNRNSFPLQKKARVQRAEDMLLNAVDEYNMLCKNGYSLPIIRPNRYHFAKVIDGWAKSNHYNSPQRAEDLLLRMIDLYQNCDDDSYALFLQPDRVVFSTVIKAWSRIGEAPRANSWLLRMENEYKTLPDERAYTCAIHAWIKAQEMNKVSSSFALKRAEELLQLMQRRYDEGENMCCKPDTYTYNTLLHGYAQSDDPSAPYNAERLLLMMNEIGIKADLVTYSSVINAWAKNMANVEGAPYRAEELLKEVVQQYEGGDVQMKPDVVIYNVVIDAWAKSGENIAASRVDEILKMMELSDTIEPDSVTYASVIDCYSKSGKQDAGYRAEEVLDRMIARYESGSHVARPTVYVYTAVIDCWSKCNVSEAPTRAELILERMKSRYDAGDKFSKPNIFTYSSLIDLWARSDEENSFKHAEKLYELIESSHQSGDQRMKPNAVTLSSYMKALLKCNDGDFAVQKADEILENMLIAFQSGEKDMRPSKAIVNTAFDIWKQVSPSLANSKKKSFLQRLKSTLQ